MIEPDRWFCQKIGAAQTEGKTLYPPGCMSYYSINIFYPESETLK